MTVPARDRAALAVVGESAWLTAGLAVQGLGRLGYLALVGSLAPAAMPDVAAALALALVATLAWPAAAGNAALRFLPTAASSTVLRSSLSRTTGLVAVGMGLLTGPVMLAMTGDPVTAFWSAMLVTASAWFGFSRSALIANRRIVRVVIADVGLTGITLLVVPGLAVADLGTSWWLAPVALGQVAACLISWPPRPSGTVTVTDRRSAPGWPPGVLAFIGHNTVAAVASGVLIPAATLATRVFDPAQAGAFAAAVSLATPINMAGQSLIQVLIVRFAGLSGGRPTARVQREGTALFWISCVVWFVLFGLLYLAAGPLLSLVYNGNFDHALPMLVILLAATGLQTVVCVPLAMLVATGRERLQSRIMLWCNVVALLVIATAPLLGVTASLTGYSLGAVSAAVVTTVVALRPSGSVAPELRGLSGGNPDASLTPETS